MADSVPPLAPDDIDRILCLQLAVAWAGEGAGEPRRLGWWRTDLVDAEGGGDLFRRLVPRTAAWAGLQAAREAAVRKDAELRRSKLADPDGARTLFHFGFAVDEQIRERLEHHKRHGRDPKDVFDGALPVYDAWNPDDFAKHLSALATPKTEIVPGARKLSRAPKSEREQAEALTAALVPLTPEYPLPFFEVSV